MTSATSPLKRDAPSAGEEFDESDHFLDGYMAAIAVSPRDVPASTWTAIFSDLDSAGAPSVAKLEQALGSLRRMLAIAPGEYTPLYFESGDNYARFGIVFAAGFFVGMTAAGVAWAKKMREADYWDAIEPIAALAMEHETSKTLYPAPLATPEPMRREDLDECLGMVPDCIADLYRMRLETMAMLPRHGHAKTGRNDPCPCGSGRKFKKCCGR